MVLGSLQQDFLPTDTASLVEASPGVPLSLWVAVIFVAIGFITAKSSRSSTLFMLGVSMIFVGFGMSLAGVSSQVQGMGNGQEDRDNAKVADVEGFVSNIESVYDVKVVLPEGEDFEVSPERERDARVIQDGIAYEVLVVQDPDSYEPTLIPVATDSVESVEFRKK